MQQLPDAFLIVEKGEPCGVGEALPLSRGKVLLGRDSPDRERGFFFFSPFVSRRHAMIEFKDGSYFLTDLESRHGTGVKDEQLPPGEPRQLGDQDRISLARDGVVLIFSMAAPVGGETWDYPESQPDSLLILDPDRRKVILDGQPLTLTGRPHDLLHLLYENQGRAVSTLDIKKAVWKDRGLGADGLPLVTNEEVTTLVYRLRESLKPHRELIRTVPSYGYMLDLEETLSAL
ncbi:FHA domain-containing protein [Chloroflexota bacterium]